MIVGGPFLPCCCGDQPEPPCANLTHAEAPDTISVSLAYTLDWESHFWHIVEAWDVDTRPTSGAPCVNAGYSQNTFPYSRCGPAPLPPDIYQCAQEEYLACPSLTGTVDAVYNASLSIQAFGELSKTSSSTWNAGSSPVIYRGQIFFEYDFSSDFPDTDSASGSFMPASPAPWGAVTSGLRVEVLCVKPQTAFVRGMCQPYYPQHPNGIQPEEVLYSGPHIAIRATIDRFGLASSHPGSVPSETDGGPQALVRLAEFGLNNPVNDVPGGSIPRGVRGWNKLQPWTTIWAKSGLPLNGAYNLCRNGSIGNTQIYPITRSDIACVDPCVFNPESLRYRNGACDLEPARGPRVAGQLSCCEGIGGQFYAVDRYGPGSQGQYFQCPQSPSPCASVDPNGNTIDVLCGTSIPSGSRRIQFSSEGTEAQCYQDRVGNIWEWQNNRGAFTDANASISIG